METPIVSLENLGSGAAVELFDDARQKVLANINDPNTKAQVVREITLKVKIKPISDQRDVATVEMQAIPKLAPVNPCQTSIAIGKTINGDVEAREWSNPQPDMFAGESPAKVYRVGGEE